MTVSQKTYDALDLADGSDNDHVPPSIQAAWDTLMSSESSAEEKAEAATTLLNYLQKAKDDGEAIPQNEIDALEEAQTTNTRLALAQVLGVDPSELAGLDWSSLTPKQITAVFQLLIDIGIITEDDLDSDIEGFGGLKLGHLIDSASSGSSLGVMSSALSTILELISGALEGLGMTTLSANVDVAQEKYQQFADSAFDLGQGPKRHPGGNEGYLADFELFVQLGGELGLFDPKEVQALLDVDSEENPTNKMYHDVRSLITNMSSGSSGSSGYGNWTVDFIGSTSLDDLFNELSILNEEIIAAVMNGDPVAKSRAETAKMILQMKIQLLMSLL